MPSPTPASPLPNPLSLTHPQLTHLLTLYPPTLHACYALNPRLKSATRLADALADDAWRYDELGRRVAGRRRRERGGKGGEEGGEGEEAGWLEKEGELDRLVGWKM